MSDEKKPEETKDPSVDAKATEGTEAEAKAAAEKPEPKAKAEPEAKKPEPGAKDAKAEAKPEAKKPEAGAGESKAEAKPAAKTAKPEEKKADRSRDSRGGGGGGGRGRGGDRGDRGGRRGRRGDQRGDSGDGLYEKVVKINRTAKVVKGGRRFSFSVLGVVGDQKGRVGFGMGKANGVPAAIKKALEKARQNMITVPLTHGRTIPFPVEARFSGARLVMRPATPGTGIIAGGACRAVIEAVGIQDILTKRIGSSTPGNVLRASFKCLQQLKGPRDIARLRGISLHQLFNGHDAPPPEPKPEADAEAGAATAAGEA